MKIKKVHITQLNKSKTFLAPYHINIEPIKERYHYYLNRKLKDSNKLPFHKMADRVDASDAKKSDIVIRNHPSGKLLIEIIKNQTVKLNWIVYRINNKKVSPEYLLWHFSQPKIKDYINIHAVGSVIRHIPVRIIEDSLIPIPKVLDEKSKKCRISLKTNNNLVREFIRNFYLDYQENLDNKRYETAIILAGAICYMTDIANKMIGYYQKQLEELADVVNKLGNK